MTDGGKEITSTNLKEFLQINGFNTMLLATKLRKAIVKSKRFIKTLENALAKNSGYKNTDNVSASV